MMIRKMTMDDYESVYGVWTSCVGMGLNDLDDSKEGIAKFLNRNPETCFVAEEERRIVGAILVGNDGRRGYIYHTAVLPAYRRRGIASQLVAAVMDALEALGIHKAALVVFTRNTDGNAFWETVGFTSREDLTYRNKAIHDLIRMDT